jgi:hypothetical protein
MAYQQLSPEAIDEFTMISNIKLEQVGPGSRSRRISMTPQYKQNRNLLVSKKGT